MRRNAGWTFVAALGTVAVLGLAGGGARSYAQEGYVKRKVQKTEDEWRKVLPRDVFMVTRLKATEAPFTGKYFNNHAKGSYLCACCSAPLFSSQHKFESGTGWPSFFQPTDFKLMEFAVDDSMPGEVRREVMCKDCGAHLGHVFDDGPPPTGLRYCINSASLKFKPAVGASGKSDEATTGKGKARAKAKSKTKARGKSKNADAPEEKPADPATPEPEKDKPATTKEPG